MTAYSFSGLLVDVKAYNWHMSAPVDATLNNNYNTEATQILVGGLVIPGADAGSIDNAGADAADVLGVMNESRPAGTATDKRSVSYTWAGVVRVITDGSAITVGSGLSPAAEGKVKVEAQDTVAHHALRIGKALEANGSSDETIIMAYVNFAH